ncbi:MAG TPA: FHA domain-containing protein [Candidatus Binatia bacterium]|jgi:hypothetical protein
MAPLGYIEVLDNKGEVVERTRIDSFPIHVGRAYSNEVVVDDPYVCPEHVTIELDDSGSLVARDLNSVNGLWLGSGGKKPVPKLELNSGSQFRIGHTLLRYRSFDHPLAPTLRDRENSASFFGSPYIAALAGITVFSLLCLEGFLGSVERVTIAGIVSEPLVTFATLLLWAGLWTLAGRVILSRFYFFEHVTIASLAIVAFFAINAGAEWAEFLFPFIPALWVASVFGAGVILAALVFGHLRFASMMRRRSRIWAASSVSAALIGISFISDYANRSKFSNVMEFTGIVKPLDAAWVPTMSVDRFIENSQKLKSDLERLAQKSKPVQP